MTDHLARINEAASRIAALETLMTGSRHQRALLVLSSASYLPPETGPGISPSLWFPTDHMPWLADMVARRVDELLHWILDGEREALRLAALDLYNSVAEPDPCAAARESVEGACPAEDIDAASTPALRTGVTCTPQADKETDEMESTFNEALRRRRHADHAEFDREMCS